MGNALIALAAATVGVIGTLLAPVLSQRLLARAQADQFDRQQRTAEDQWIRERRVAEHDRRRDSYVAANAAYRRFRIQLMNHLWLVHQGEAGPEDRQELEAARQGHHAAFSEAQMTASDAVVAELDSLTSAMAELYARTMRLAEGNPVPGGSFQEIHDALQDLWERGLALRGTMRADLGVGAGADLGAAGVTAPAPPPGEAAGAEAGSGGRARGCP
ncbi:hypothetical protein [Streptomyces sp. NPDC086023]|uniref:hypothetical protein n=1 Tax=Streptomyces sp. NPDC086023 TaxID=3365746 RepID=UPI0037D0BE35